MHNMPYKRQTHETLSLPGVPPGQCSKCPDTQCSGVASVLEVLCIFEGTGQKVLQKDVGLSFKVCGNQWKLEAIPLERGPCC